MTALVAQQRTERAPTVRMGFDTADGFELLQRTAKAFASSNLVPPQYQNNLANCMIAMEMAGRIGASPMQVMQSLYIVHEQPSWSSKFLIACINSCGRFTSLRYEWRGEPGADNYGCRAWAVELRTGERLDGIWVDWKMVKAEGWNSRKGSKWLTMPDQMFIYRAAAFWQRAYAPEIAMGMLTVEERQDMIDIPSEHVGPNNRNILDALNASLPSPGEQAPQASAPALDGAEPMTYAQVRERIDKARDLDTLDIAGDFIGAVPDAQQRTELAAILDERRAALEK